jgi:hypothetical protein
MPSSTSFSINVNTPPSIGHLIIQPSTGNALSTIFNV